MYDIQPPAIYAHESVVTDPRYRQRVERVVGALTSPPDVTVYGDDDLPSMIDGGLIAGRVAMGTLEAIPDPILLFNTFRFDGRRAEREQWLKELSAAPGYHLAEAMLGYGPFSWWTEENIGKRVCRPCWRVHFQNGCIHKCHYCSLGGLLVTMVNVEDYIERFDRLIAAHPWQETYLLEDDAEVLCLEPELGCLGPIIEYFGTLAGRYLIIHAKSANVDWMLDLKHNGNTIIVWSMSTPGQAEAFEPVAGSTSERIEAARRAQEAGYVVRYKFKPIIPIRNWRREAAETVAAIFEKTNPDVISLAVFMWMDAGEMKRRLDASLLDADCLAAAEAAVERMADESCKPFPPEVRAEIYEFHFNEIRRHNAEIPVSLSTESPVLWGMLGEKLATGPATYVCGCGPNSTPWRKRLDCNPFTINAAGPVGGFERM